ncbi:hypothetical protein LNV09_20960 [Paucibacter sp. B2R-40]|uniref:hypothetical protein n=1 Tax=Paucibacter sp. B2R-40 TaxID=2893554 RepID=UPI0021E37AB1|nr:hypothetical protein [Paucibacter sp. B2R-40]MCV2356618.1 hypothetical protein [Paucibacter sp. B2R-40]
MTDIDTPLIPSRILKAGTCPTLSGRSNLAYQVACADEPEASESNILIRVISNTGGGYFSKDWVKFADVVCLISAPVPLTFSTLQPLFAGRSVNTGGFLMAVLKHLAVIRAVANNPRIHEKADIDGFLAEIQTLMASEVSLREDAKPDGAKGNRRKTITMPKSKKGALET